MSEVLRGARYALGALTVMTVWSIGLGLIVEWRWENRGILSSFGESRVDELMRELETAEAAGRSQELVEANK